MPRLVTLTLAVAALSLTGADWRQFRGADSSNVAEGPAPPTSFGEDENIAWKAELPGRGLSGPIVVDGQVVLTASSGPNQGRLHVLSFDASSGKKLWERQFWATGRTQTHRKMCVATPTPASDGQRIFAFYSSNDLACLDLEGNLQWFRGLGHDFPNASNSLGMASSPVVVDDTVIVQVESDAESFSSGIDVETGQPRWRITRPRRANWTSPTVFESGDETLVLLQSSEGLSAVRPRSGEVVWTFDNGASTIPSSTVADGLVYAPSNGLTVLNPAGAEPEVVWKSGRLSPSTPSPVVYRGKVYTVNRSGVVSTADARTGKPLEQLRLQGGFSATPVAAGGHLYFFNEKGQGQVVKVGEESDEVVGGGNLGETILGTPAVADGAIYVRSDDHLWKIAE